ncbi:MAG: hypothetical protein REI12_10400 [Pedobacter sp.]|nr:hypothetical protein [Pedobacter sp.]
MRMLPLYFAFAMAAFNPVAVLADMVEMNQQDLSDATGQEGIAIELELRVNTTDSMGTPMTACTLGINAAGSTACRLAMQFANRGSFSSAQAGDEWTVWKGYYGTIRFPSIYLNAATNPSSASGMEDLGRFTNASGQVVSPYGKSVLQLTFPQDIEVWNLNITGISVEYGAAGYLNTVSTSTVANPASMGLKMAGTGINQPATLNVQGAVTVFGF